MKQKTNAKQYYYSMDSQNTWHRYPKEKQQRKSQYSEWVRQQNYPKEIARVIRLEKELQKLGDFPSGNIKKIILYNVSFLNIVSQFQDNGYLKHQPKAMDDTQQLFNTTIKMSGRQDDPYKWNYTKKGEKVTTLNVFYGGVFGLPIKPASYWLSLPRTQKIGIDYHSKVAANLSNSPVIAQKTLWQTQAIVEAGVEKFTENNSQVLMRCVNKLLKYYNSHFN